MTRLHRMTKAEIIQAIWQKLGPGRDRIALDSGPIRDLGWFMGPCGALTMWRVIRVTTHGDGITARRLHYFAIGETRATSSGQTPWLLDAGKIGHVQYEDMTSPGDMGVGVVERLRRFMESRHERQKSKIK